MYKGAWFSRNQGHIQILDVAAAEHSWGDINTIKYGNMSAIISDVSDKHTIVYTYACIESVRIARSESDLNIDERYPRHVWDYDYEVLAISWKNGVLTRLLWKNNIGINMVEDLY